VPTSILRQHGQYIHPECEPTAGGDGAGAFGQSTTEQRPQTRGKGIIKRFRKDESVAQRVIAFGWIKATYADAIEYTGFSNEARGIGFVLSTFNLALFGGAAIWGGLWPSSFDWDDLSGTVLGAFLAIGLALFALFITLFLGRLEFFRPSDEPVIFDRRKRKVYRIFRETAPGWKGLLQRWPIYAVENDWNLIDVEHNAAIATSGAVVSQQNSLTFLVRKSADDPTIIDFFNVGQIAVFTEQSVPPVWEHIRRFMEEDGPHIPPGEGVFVPDVPMTIFQAIRGVTPMGQMRIGEWAAAHPFFAVFFVLLFPIFGPVYLVWGIGNWLSYKTATSISWPDEVLQAVGPATAGQSSGGSINTPPAHEAAR
jgi:hypothetical protein